MGATVNVQQYEIRPRPDGSLAIVLLPVFPGDTQQVIECLATLLGGVGTMGTSGHWIRVTLAAFEVDEALVEGLLQVIRSGMQVATCEGDHDFGRVEAGRFAKHVRRCRRCPAVQTLREITQTEADGVVTVMFRVIGQSPAASETLAAQGSSATGGGNAGPVAA